MRIDRLLRVIKVISAFPCWFNQRFWFWNKSSTSGTSFARVYTRYKERDTELEEGKGKRGGHAGSESSRGKMVSVVARRELHRDAAWTQVEAREGQRLEGRG